MGYLFRPKCPTQRVSVDDVLDPGQAVSLNAHPACTLEIMVPGGNRVGQTHRRSAEPSGLLVSEVGVILGDCLLYPKEFHLDRAETCLTR